VPLSPFGTLRLDLGGPTALFAGVLDADGLASVGFPAPADPGLIDISLYWQAFLVAEQALGNLDEDFKAVIVLRDIEQLDYAQISQTLDLPLGTVKSRLFRARLALRQEIDRLCAPPAEGLRLTTESGPVSDEMGNLSGGGGEVAHA